MNTKHLRDSETIVELFYGRVAETPDAVAFEHEIDGKWIEFTFNEFGDWVGRAALGFHSLGLGEGDCIAIWGDTLPEWTVLNLAGATVGAHTAGIYQTSTPEQAEYILKDSGTKFMCVDTPERLQEALALRENTPDLKGYILWSGERPETDAPVYTLEELLALGDEVKQLESTKLDTLRDSVTPEHYAVLIYTSGTTGLPKGVILTHSNCVNNAIKLFDGGLLEAGDTSIAFLPLSHVAEYTMFIGRLFGNVRAYFCPDFQKIGDVVREKKPSLLIAVPRVHEKVYQKILGAVEAYPPRKQRIFYWAVEQGKKITYHKWEGKSIPPNLAITYKLADTMVLSKIRQQLGGNVRLLGSAAAPIDRSVIEFFWSIGIPLMEAYGLSESGGASHTNTPKAFKIGTVGQVVDGYECKIAEDGEVLLKGPAIFQGYLNRDEDTKEALGEDGWLYTGDIGDIDDEGFLRITDRKKNLIITAGGKNVAPSKSETLIKRDPVISQAVVIGDRKPYLVALITLSEEAGALEKEKIESRIDKAIQDANEHLAKYETVKNFRILDNDFSVESGEMTPTMKVKRNIVMKNYADLIEEMYTKKSASSDKEKVK